MILLTYIKIIPIIMISKFLKKQKDIQKKKKLIKAMIFSLRMPEKQKKLYLDSLDIVNQDTVNNLYNNLTKFISDVEMREIEQINKDNFSSVVWMRKKEAEDKKKELNAFSFLLSNI